MRMPYKETITFSNGMEWEYTRHKCTSDECLYGTDDHYIGYDRPLDYCHDHTRRRGAETYAEITSVSLDSIMDAYNDYKMSMEW